MVVFVGYSDESKGWRFWNPLIDRLVESSDVIFDEQTGYSPAMFPSQGISVNIPRSLLFNPVYTPLPLPIPPPVVVGDPDPVGVPEEVGVPTSLASMPSLETDSPESTSPSSSHLSSSTPIPLHPSSSFPSDSPPDPTFHDPDEPLYPKYKAVSDLYPTPSTASTSPRHSTPSSASTSPRHSTSYANMIHTAETYREPATYKQATMSPQAQYWKVAMEREYDSLMENRTWVLVPPPPGRNIIHCKWVYKIKYASNGTIDKYKARLVAKGYSQVHGVDYTETFSPVIKHDSIRVLFAIAAILRMHMKQFDIGTAYLNSDLTTRIYMHQPEGFVHSQLPSHVCLLLKSLYGLKQSGRLWNHTFDHFLKLYNLLVSDADTCVYYRPTATHFVDLIVGIFVDDGIVCASNPKDLDDVIQHLARTFKVTHGPMDYYVGFQVHQDPIHHTIFINQARYISDILHRFQLETANPVSTPADTHIHLQATPGPDDALLPSSIPYREAVGCLMYAMVLTRPDIAYAVSRVAKFTSNPHTSHWTAVKRIFRYLSGTLNLGISYYGLASDLLLRGYCDADYAGDHDDRKSRTGYVFLLANGAIAWCSKRQGCTADSTTEAEFVALAESAKEAIWLRHLLHSLGSSLRLPTTIFSDNQSAIQLVKNPKYHKRTKHIETKYYLIREKYLQQQIEVQYVHTKQQIADLLTKALPRETFHHLRALQGLVAPPSPTSGRIIDDVLAKEATNKNVRKHETVGVKEGR
jgi:hypothetical protein